MTVVVEPRAEAGPVATRPVPPRDHPVWKSPLYEQYWRVRDGVPGCLLFFRMGDFYELFGEDAVRAAPCLGVQLTARNKNDEFPVPMCGVPVHAVDSYAEKLLTAGYRVALCEQLEEASAKSGSKLVERRVVRILTPGLPVDPDRLSAREGHYLLSLPRLGTADSIEVVALDFLGGRLFEGELRSREELDELVARVRPSELLFDPADEDKLRGRLPMTPKLMTPWTGRGARERLENYLLYTQRCESSGLARLLPHAQPLARLAGRASTEHARLPASVLEQWAVDSHLARLLDRSASAVGSRKLREILTSPLRNRARLERRQRLWEALKEPERVLAPAAEVYDLERCLGRFRVGVAAPRELLRLLASLKNAAQALAAAPESRAPLAAIMADEGLPALGELEPVISPLVARLEAALDTQRDPASSEALALLLKPGFDPEMDRLRALLEDSESWLAGFEERLQRETGIPSLKVRFNRVFGYYIEVTKTHLSKVPPSFYRKQTTVNGERFSCDELRARESEILGAQARAEARARQLLEALQGSVLENERALRDYVQHFAWLDAWAGARAAVERLGRFGPWSQARYVDGPARFDLREGRHPVIEAYSGSFVPNSLALGTDADRLLLLTGPNMAGKSTFMRQVGLCLLLAQCGLPVPAASLELAPVSGFYSRMGASDRIFEGESTFMVEMREAALILRESDADSFVLIDEIGRGTGTEDGLAIAQAVLEHLQSRVGALTIFATHFRELARVATILPGARNASLGIQEWEGELVFLRRLVNEAAESSYGIHVAEMAGLPTELLERARGLFVSPAAAFREPEGSRPSRRGRASAFSDQVSLFDRSAPAAPALSPGERRALERLRALRLDELSPRAAWALLAELEAELSQEGRGSGPSATI